MEKQRTALELASILECGPIWKDCEDAAAELRRLHETLEATTDINEQLRRERDFLHAMNECLKVDLEAAKQAI